MPESQEKRQRTRRKQLKRQEKLKARVMRNSEKRGAAAVSGSLRYYILYRGDNEHFVDNVLWLGTLNLAAHHGWVPQSARPGEDPRSEDFARPSRLHLSANEAEGLARSVEAELVNLTDDPVEIEGELDFGEEHTAFLLDLRLDGKVVEEAEVMETRAVLSGPAKKDAKKLVSFLHGGEFGVEES